MPTHGLPWRRTRRAVAMCALFAVVATGACSDEEKDEPQRDNTGETVDTPTSVEDTRTTFGSDD